MQRIEDDLPLDVAQNAAETVETGREYTLLTWNLGFGAYSDDFSFFMDGGEHARALSKAAVEENISAMAARSARTGFPTSRFCRKWTWTPTAVGTSMSAPCW